MCECAWIAYSRMSDNVLKLIKPSAAPRGRLVKTSDPLRLIPGLGTRMSNPLVPPGLPPRLTCPSGRPCVSEAPRFELGSQIAGKFQCAIPGSARDQGIVSGEPPKPPSRHRVLGTRRAKGRPTSCSGRPPSMLLFHTARVPGPTKPIGNQIVSVRTYVFLARICDPEGEGGEIASAIGVPPLAGDSLALGLSRSPGAWGDR